MTATQVDPRPHFTAVNTLLNTVLAPNFAYAIDKIPGTSQNATEAERTMPLPNIYAELGVEPRYVPPTGVVQASRRGGWRITVRCVGRTVNECSWVIDKVNTALRNGRYLVDGDPVRTSFESGQQPEWDDRRYAALLTFTAAH